MKYKVTRKQIIDAAESLIGTPFLHQGRDETTGVDCVGLLVVIGQKINYPEIFDRDDYRRVPSAKEIRDTLAKNCDQIPLSEARPGDMFLMRLHGRKPRHTAVYYSDEVDTQKGLEPTLIHASASGVRVEPLSNFPAAWFVAAYRVRGLKV